MDLKSGRGEGEEEGESSSPPPPRWASFSAHGLREHVQGIHSTGRNAEQQLLRTDLNQNRALLRTERDVRNDFDRTGARPAEVAQTADDPRRGEHSREHEHQRQRDLREASRRPCGNGFSRFRRRKRLLGRERDRVLG